MNEFQYRLQKMIAERGITASELSRMSGVGKSDISNYINGVYIPKQNKVYMLAHALGVDPGWLMTGDEPPRVQTIPEELYMLPPDHEELILLDAWRNSSDWQKSAVRKLLNMKEESE